MPLQTRLLNDNPPIDAWEQKAIDDYLAFMEGVAVENYARFGGVAKRTGAEHAYAHAMYWYEQSRTISYLRTINSQRKIDPCLCHRDSIMPNSTHLLGGGVSQPSLDQSGEGLPLTELYGT